MTPTSQVPETCSRNLICRTLHRRRSCPSAMLTSHSRVRGHPGKLCKGVIWIAAQAWFVFVAGTTARRQMGIRTRAQLLWARQMPALASLRGSAMQSWAAVVQVLISSSNLETRGPSFRLLLERSARGKELPDAGTSKARPLEVWTACSMRHKA